MYEVVYYRLSDGTAPVETFIDGLPNSVKARMLYSISLLETFGTKLRRPYVQDVKGGLFAIRVRFDRGEVGKIYYFQDKDRIVLTGGFFLHKSSTPKTELETARRCRADYLANPQRARGNDYPEHLRAANADPGFASLYKSMRPQQETIKALLSARMELGMTQNQLADITGVCQSNISRIESGVVSPTLDTLTRLAEALGKRLEVEFK